MGAYMAGEFPSPIEILNGFELEPEETQQERALRKEITAILKKKYKTFSELDEIECLITGCETEMCSAGFEKGFRFALSLILGAAPIAGIKQKGAERNA